MKNWQEVLAITGVLTAQQLLTNWNIVLDDIAQSHIYVQFRDAIWDPSRFGHGRQMTHRVAITQTYLDLHEVLSSWQPAPVGIIHPDALIQFAGAPSFIALEVDTAKETRQQWQAKFDGYHADPPAGLLIVAYGKTLRQQRLRQWCDDAGLSCPVWCQDASALKHHSARLADWARTQAVARPFGPTSEISGPRKVRYAAPLDPNRPTGAREVRAGYDLVHPRPH